MKLLFKLLCITITLIWSTQIYSQESLIVTDPGQKISTQMMNPDAECTGTGSLIYDDNSFENGYGWNATVTDGRFVQLFTPPSYPWQFSTFCLALTRLAAGTPTFTFDIVMYDNTGAGGAPGNQLGIVSGVTATNIPIWTTLAYYDYVISTMPPVASGSVYLGIKYNPSLDASPHYSGADESTTTPLHLGYAWSGTAWSTIESLFTTYRAMSYRSIGSSGPPCTVGVPTNPSPANGATNVAINGVNLGWTNGAGTTQVEVWFGPQGNVVQVYSGAPITSYPLPTLTYLTDYAWYVKCGDGTCFTYGPNWTFTTMQDPNLVTLFCDDFTAGLGNWTITNDGGSATCVWSIYQATEYTLPPTAVGNVMSADADACNGTTGNSQTTAVHSGIDATMYQTVWLEFDNDWQAISTADFAYVDVSTNGGATWQNVLTFNATDIRNTHEVWDLTTLVALKNFSIRFKTVQPGWDWWWAVDNICIYATDIIPAELISFTAAAYLNEVELNWITATETNNKGFEVQRSNGNAYETIAFVEGHGTTTEINAYSYTDRSLNSGSYSYRLRQIDFDGTFEYSKVVSVEVSTPSVFALDQNYPNPFNPSTKITFSLAIDSKVSLKVFDILGQEVATLVNSNLAAGGHSVNFDASVLNSGVYLYRIEATGIDGSNFIDAKKMILTK